jgi:hypothetical protein
MGVGIMAFAGDVRVDRWTSRIAFQRARLCIQPA